MGEFEDKLNSILGDPQTMNQLMNMASAFRNSATEPQKEAGDCPELDPETLSRVMRIATEFNRKDDGSATLLYAIRPYLSKGRQSKFKDALTVMRLARLIPRIKKEGLF